MCGILAVFAPEGSAALLPEKVKSLSQRQCTRGPDATGVLVGRTWALAHERLSIMDPKESANQPFTTPEGVSLVANGEIYNWKDLLAQLEKEGKPATMRTGSDSEVILQCYLAWGADRTVRALKGMFAFVIWDERKGEIFAARDSVGIKPLYHGTDSQNSLEFFGSELKTLHDQCAHLKLFPPGHMYTSSRGLEKFYVPEWNSDSFSPTQRPTRADIREGLKNAVRARMMSDVPYGSLLSGGLDSCIVTSLMAEIAREDGLDYNTGGVLKTFTVGMEGSPDIMAARAMSKILGSEHHEYLFTPEEAFKIIPKVIYHLETYETELIRSAIPNYFLAKCASREVKMVITGEGSDELFCGYQYFQDATGAEALQQESRRIFSHLHMVNLQRCDRMCMAWGLEARVPFLDTDFIHSAYSIAPEQKLIQGDSIEKQFLREAFADGADSNIPRPLLFRTKAMQCEGVGMDWVGKLQSYAGELISDEEFALSQTKYTINPPHSKEECYYRNLFEEYFPGKDEFVHVWDGGCRAGGASWDSATYTRHGLADVSSLKHAFMEPGAPVEAN
jgi:asparagine synthase (glutamine-hydrolysing)